MDIDRIQARYIGKDESIIQALHLMDMVNSKLLMVVEGNILLKLLSIGDIQRAVLNNISLDEKLISITRDDFRVAKIEQDKKDIIDTMIKYRMEFMPVVNSSNEIINVVFWEDTFDNDISMHSGEFNLPVVIMAGGLGTRLRPLTNIIPKPLLPIGSKTIIEEIIERFNSAGCNQFFLSLNYMANTLKTFFKDKQETYSIDCYTEDLPLGTAGSLLLIKENLKTTFFVSNCDILIDCDYFELLDYHKTQSNDITIVSSLKNIKVPYGTLKTTNNGLLKHLQEKPNILLQINTGMYILEPSVIDFIPSGKMFNITDLIDKVIDKGGKVGVFPISDKSWKDIGTLDLYFKEINNNRN